MISACFPLILLGDEGSGGSSQGSSFPPAYPCSLCHGGTSARALRGEGVGLWFCKPAASRDLPLPVHPGLPHLGGFWGTLCSKWGTDFLWVSCCLTCSAAPGKSSKPRTHSREMQGWKGPFLPQQPVLPCPEPLRKMVQRASGGSFVRGQHGPGCPQSRGGSCQQSSHAGGSLGIWG